MTKPGKNAGISGVINLPNKPDGQAQVQVLIRKWSLRLDGQARQRRGRGGGRYSTVRWIFAGGSVFLSGKIQSAAAPTPESWDGILGEIVIRHSAGKTITYPVQINVFEHSFNPTSLDTWDVMVTAQVLGPPVYSAAWGLPPEATAATKTDQIQWENSSKTYDPNGLLSSAQVMIDWWGDIADTDAAELTKLTTVLAAATEPITGLKVKTASIGRDALDGGTITVSYSLTDSAEDVLNPSTFTTIDPNELQTAGSVAAFNATPTIPTISGQTVVERTTTSKEINDGKTLQVTEFGNRSTKADIENPGTFTITDPSDIESKGLQTSIYANGGSVTAASVPSGLQLTSTKIETINADRKQVTYEFAKNTPKQAREFPGTFTNIDPSDLENTGRQTSVYASVDSPTAAADLSASKLYVVGTTIRFINPDQKEVIYDYARQTNAQKVTNQASYVFTDPSGLENKELAAAINDSTPATISSFPANRGTRATYLNPDNVLYVTELGERTTEQDITYLKSVINRATSLGAKDHRFVVEITTSATTGSPANPDSTNLDFRGTETYRITDTKYVHAHEFAPFTVEGEIEAEGTESTHEESAVSQPLIAEDKETVFDTNATAPTAPAHSGLVPVRVSTRKRSKTGYSHTFYYDYRTNAAKLTAEKTRTKTDLSSLESEAVTAAVYTGSAPSDPTLSGFVLVDKEDFSTSNPTYTLRVYRWGLVTNAEKIENDGTTWASDATTAEKTVETTIVASTLSGDALRDSLWGVWQDDATFEGLSVKKLVPGKYEQKIVTKSNDIVMIGGSIHTAEDTVKAIPTGLLSGTATFGDAEARVLIGKLSAVVVGGPGGAQSGRIDSIEFERTRGSFAIERRYVVTVANYDTYLYASTVGFTNDAEFLGYPANWVKYLGATMQGKIPTDGSDGIVIYRYHFALDSAMFFTCPQMPFGWVDAASGLDFASIGFFDPALILDDNTYLDLEITWPGEASFSDFIT